MSNFKKGDRILLKAYPEEMGTVESINSKVTVKWDDGKIYNHHTPDDIEHINPLDSYTLNQIIAHYGAENLMDHLGRDACAHYFGME